MKPLQPGGGTQYSLKIQDDLLRRIKKACHKISTPEKRVSVSEFLRKGAELLCDKVKVK